MRELIARPRDEQVPIAQTCHDDTMTAPQTENLNVAAFDRMPSPRRDQGARPAHRRRRAETVLRGARDSCAASSTASDPRPVRRRRPLLDPRPGGRRSTTRGRLKRARRRGGRHAAAW
ncbi:MAG: hypothetical protein MZW92_43345 [Comamonadaceae bacterium]|nr:hypothetical protein [Comamonadaceae bacterium]